MLQNIQFLLSLLMHQNSFDNGTRWKINRDPCKVDNLAGLNGKDIKEHT